MDRVGFIGGSDTVKIMQGDWLELWEIKTGRAQGPDLSDVLPVQLGIWTEDFNINWFEDRMNVKIDHMQEQFRKNIGTIPVKGMIDGKLYGFNQIIECKHTNHMNSMDAVMELYMPQVQTYCEVADADGCHLSVIFGNSRWESVFIERNKSYFDSMWSVVSDFWGYVVRDEEPIGCDAPTLSINSISVDQMVKRDASKDNAFVDAANTYVENEEQAKLFEASKKSLKEMVAKDEREVYCDLLTVKRAKNGSLRITKRSKK
jgi:hypothetical protein